ncbi:MFS transporter [Nocardia sp. NPDC052254]|uniref:MFS transporter n=1 Tax=Nocardia sp. NPDC052254 TaxID=3155681 RepID=UPI003432ADE5
MPVVVATPRFRFSDLITFAGYRQGAIAFLQYGTAVGAVYFVVGPLLAAMVPDVGWSLGVVSAALLVRGLLSAGMGPLTGWLVSRFGVRPIVLIGGVTTAVCTALTGLVRNPVEFMIVFGIALTVADSFMGYTPAATLVQKWFLGRRAVVMGFVNSGAGFGGLIFAPLMGLLVRELGWRHAMFALAVIIALLAVPALWLRDDPRAAGQWVDGVTGREIPADGETDAIGTVQQPVRRILRSPVFWMLFVVFGIEAWSLGTYAAYQVLYLRSVGVGERVSSGALGIAAGVAACSGILLSRFNDRISPYYVLIASTTAMTTGSVIFAAARSSPPLYVYSILFGAGYGMLVPTVAVALGRYYGARNFPRAFGAGQLVAGTMGGLGPYLTGRIVDATHSYEIPVHLVTGLLAGSVVLAVAARPPRHALRPVREVDPAALPAAAARPLPEPAGD